MRKVLFPILFILSVFRLSGQAGQDQTRISLAYPVYSQYLHNGLIINPAYAGSREALSFFLSGRIQWMGIKGAPVSQTVSLHTLLKNDRVGLGLSGQFFQFGFSKSTSLYTDYAYHVVMGKGRFSMGLRAGVDISNTDYSGILLIDPGDPAFLSNDKPYILPNVGAGVYYYDKKFFLGASVPSILSYVKNSAGAISFNTFRDFDVLVTAGVLITFSPAFKFKPSVFIDYPVQKTRKTRIDLNGNFILYDIVWIGGSWRTSENVTVGILQFQITPQMMLGYSYDYPVGKMNSYSSGSHEIVFRYEFGYRVSVSNPRYF